MTGDDRRTPPASFRHPRQLRDDRFGGRWPAERVDRARGDAGGTASRVSLIEAAVARIYPEATRLESILLGSADWRTRRRIRTVLQDQGYVVRETASGDDLILRAGWNRPSLIVIDLDLRVLDGWQTASRLRGNLATDGIPLLAIHDEASEITVRRLRQAGFSGVLTPPLREQDVLAGVDRALASAREGLRAPRNGGEDDSV